MSEAEQRPAFIGVDWGTSSFRAWLFDDKGGVLDLVPVSYTHLTLPTSSWV